MSDDELLLALGRANPYPLTSVEGAAHSISATAVLEEIIRSPRSRLHWRSVRSALRRACRLDALDPFDLLSGVNPVPVAAAAVVDPNELERRAALVDAIVSGSYVPGAAWNRRRTLTSVLTSAFGRSATPRRAEALPRVTVGRRLRPGVLVPIACASVLVASAAGFVIARAHPTGQRTVCYAAASTATNQASIGDVNIDGVNNVAGCAAAWFNGAFGAPRRPHLVACVLPNGYVGVFPGRNEQLCTKLNLSIALAPSARVKAVNRLSNALQSDLRLSNCVSLPDARTIVRRELAKDGLAGLKVVATGDSTTSAQMCTTYISTSATAVHLTLTAKVDSPAPLPPRTTK